MRKAIIIPCAILSVLALALVLELDYDRYADNITESVTETIESVSVTIDESPKIPVYLGCEDLYDQLAYLEKQYEQLPTNATVREATPILVEGEEIKAELIEHNCQEWWIKQQ